MVSLQRKSRWKSITNIRLRHRNHVILSYIEVVFPFMGSLSLDRYHLYFLMILNETLTFLSLSNPVLQYALPKTCKNLQPPADTDYTALYISVIQRPTPWSSPRTAWNGLRKRTTRSSSSTHLADTSNRTRRLRRCCRWVLPPAAESPRPLSSPSWLPVFTIDRSHKSRIPIRSYSSWMPPSVRRVRRRPRLSRTR